MTMMPEQWARVEAVFDAALDLPPAERPAYVAEACKGDDVLQAEVRRLLAAHDDERGPLAAEPSTTPAALFAAPLIARTVTDADDGSQRPDPATVRHPARVGAWRIIGVAGQGGMGAVYLAERDDGVFHMRAALKLVHRGLHFDPQFVRRFREERQILARLDHPGIARVIDGGITEDGLPYYVMEYVDGEPIDEWCDTRRLPVDARLALFAKVCDGVAAAHRLGIVHRDLKPSNVFVTEQGEPKLLDFGIAKMLEPWSVAGPAPTALTRTGERLLTPEYASPEQLRGEPPVPATDVYSLGVLLYELLTGRRPHARDGRSRHEVDRAVLDEPPPRPSSAVTDSPPSRPGTRPNTAISRAGARGLDPTALRQRLRGDLDAVVLMALRKEPARRYRDAAELAADVRRCADGQPVAASGDAIAYRARAWLRRHHRLVAAAIAGMLVGSVALGLVARRVDRTPDDGDTVPHGAVARRFYDDGMRAYARGNWSEAVRMLGAASREDSTFVLAALYASEAAARDEDYVARDAYLEQAVRLADVAPARERLIVRAFEAYRLRLPTQRAYADSLLALDPADLEAQLAAARADFTAGEFLGAVRRYRAIIAADSAAMRTSSGLCAGCQAAVEIVDAYAYADSLDAALRQAIDLTELRPRAAGSWRTLALVRLWRADTDETPYRKVLELDPGDADYAAEWIADLRIRQGEFRDADDLLRARIQVAPARGAERALWTLITSLRNQERWVEALVLARQFRALATEVQPGTAPVAAVLEAQVLMESGQPRTAAALFDSISRFVPASGGAISHRVWQLAHRADALFLAGDTAPLAAIADTMHAIAHRSGYGRDPRLEHHVRGLLLAARGHDADAVESFRRAVYSWPLGYTRTNLALSRSLLKLGRSDEAVAALQPSLRGSLEVNNLYATHTTLRRALAEAWRAAGRADSAAAHDAWVARAITRQ
jgi:serine/threonine protein kinase/tetratricopeptide (TPR) repeat protein